MLPVSQLVPSIVADVFFLSSGSTNGNDANRGAPYKPAVVFHAPAYKHVPMIEESPWQAVTNNIRGSHRVMEACVAHGTRENFTAWLMTHIADLYHLAETQDGCATRSRLHAIVPEYTPGDTDCIL